MNRRDVLAGTAASAVASALPVTAVLAGMEPAVTAAEVLPAVAEIPAATVDPARVAWKVVARVLFDDHKAHVFRTGQSQCLRCGRHKASKFKCFTVRWVGWV